MTRSTAYADSFFDHQFQSSLAAKDAARGDESDWDYEDLANQFSYKGRNPLVRKLGQWRQNIRSAMVRLRDGRGGSEGDSRPNSALSNNSSLGSGRSSPALEVVDFIDDDYLSLRRRVRLFHHHLCRVFNHLDGALKRGPPLAGRLDAFKTTFKSGPVSQFPEEAVANSFSEFCLDLTTSGKLAMSLRDSSNAFHSSASLRQDLVVTARSVFLAPLTEFLSKDWREICAKDKELRQLAKRIQKEKVDGKLAQSEIGALMAQFTAQRQDVLDHFDHILGSEIPLTKRLINLVEAYRVYHYHNTKLFHELETALRAHLGQDPPDQISSIEECHPGVDTRNLDSTASVQIEENGNSVGEEQVTNTNLANEQSESSPSIRGGPREMGGAPLSGLGMCGAGDVPASDSAAQQAIWKTRKLQPIQKFPPPLAGYSRPSYRAYGFVRSAYAAAGPEELDLVVGDLVFLDTKLRHEETEQVWVCGEVSDGLRRRAGLFPLSVVEVIIDL